MLECYVCTADAWKEGDGKEMVMVMVSACVEDFNAHAENMH